MTTTTFQLNVTGPNIGYGGEFHVHTAGCGDLRRSPYRNNPESGDEEWGSLQEMVETYYCHQIAEGDATWQEYATDFKVFPCVVGFPTEAQ